jgi:small ligand-binding sensory domain FIST
MDTRTSSSMTDALVRCAVGVSTSPDITAAIRTAAADARAGLGAGADLAVAFVSGGHDSPVRPALEGLADELGVSHVIATTAEAVLAGGEEIESGPAVAVWLARLPGATIVPLSLEYAQAGDGGVFLGWPDELEGEWPPDATLLLLADPFSFNVDRLMRRIDEDHPGVPVIGGFASGGARPGGNTLVVGPTSYDSGAVGVVIGGVPIRPVVSQGCRPIGTPLVVTKAEENLIVELGGRPALERLREIFAALDPATQLLVKTSLHVGRAASEYQDHRQRGNFLVRNVVGADPDMGVIAIGDVVRVGQTVQFHVRDAASAHDDLAALLAERRVERHEPPAGALVFTCNGRGSRLFTAPHHDAIALQESLGPVPAAGFFAQGEFGPIGRRNCIHGFTASIALFEQRY